MTLRVLVMLLVLAPLACAPASRWHMRDRPTPEDVELLLADPTGSGRIADPHRSEIPIIPDRKRLRPCCAFGSDLRVKLGPIPIPGLRIANVKGVDDLGPHAYDNGALLVRRPGDGEQELVGDERNGLVYTCRGGFIDTAHVRDYVDWAVWLAHRVALLSADGGVIELPDEGGERRVRVRPMPVVGEFASRDLIAAQAEWLSFQLSIWHEIATWYGWSSYPLFPERASAFSPEDLYSNLIGSRLLVPISHRHAARSERLYNQTVDVWMTEVLRVLGAVPGSLGREIAGDLDGTWWDSTVRLPDDDIVARRNLDLGERIAPWLAPPSALTSETRARLAEACGPTPAPLTLPFVQTLHGEPLDVYVTLEVTASAAISKREPFDTLGRDITQQDFQAILDVVRRQVLATYGARGDRPD